MAQPWQARAEGVLRLPSGRLVRGRALGRLVRGRALRRPAPAGPAPTFAVYLLGRIPPAVPWENHWLRWRDFGLPVDRERARVLLRAAWQHADTQRVELACGGGVGRTGTALACLAVLDGVPAADAVAFVRAGYHRRAVETPWQRRYVARFPG